MRNRDKSTKQVWLLRLKKTLSVSFEIQTFLIASSTSTNKVGSLTSFISEDNVSNLSAKTEAFCE